MRTRDLDGEVAALGDLARDELVALWQRNHGCIPPSGVRRELMIRSAAWHLQAKRLGGYDPECRRLLKTAVQSARTAIDVGVTRRSDGANVRSRAGSPPDASDPPAMAPNDLGLVGAPPPGTSYQDAGATSLRKARRSVGPGTRLMRDWNGKTHVVDVIDAGYVFEGKLYKSLTSIAERITGAHWSGPRFFGL